MPLLALFLASCAGESPRSDTRRPGVSTPATTAAARLCRSQLAGLGAGFSPLPDLPSSNGCSSINAIDLDSLASDDSRIGVANIRRTNCDLAQSFAGWARYGVDRAARQILGSRVVTIETFGSYSCRNVAGSGRRSAHASATAIDISGFVLADGRRVTVLDGWNGTPAEQRFLRIIHASACKRFGTVLGPEYNAAHRNHLHVEPTGGGFCR